MTTATRAITEWPTSERFDPVLRALATASDELDKLRLEFRALNDSRDPGEVALESPPVSLETIGLFVQFVTEAEGDATSIAEWVKEMREWPTSTAMVLGN